MAFDIDILISFAENDNALGGKNNMGWVSEFKKFLEFMLVQVLGEKPKILLKSEYDNLTSPKLDNVGVFISILSKDYINSTACLDHLESFCSVSNISSDIRNRIFKVFKAPVPVQEQPGRLREMPGYEMYQIDLHSGDIREYTDYFSTEAERQYWMEIVDLSYDIVDSLQSLSHKSAGQEPISLTIKKAIYVAETGHDLSVQRSILTRELQRYGYAVLPNQTLPGSASEIEKVVRRDLNKCRMSIHLIGNAYGHVPEGIDRSIVDFQNQLAAQKSQAAKETQEVFSRLIWISPDLNHINERQKTFIETIKRDVETQEETEIVQTPLADFKNIIREELIDADERKVLYETRGRAIYVMHDQIDHHDVKPYLEIIEKAGFDVLMPAFDGKLIDLRQKHIENLRVLDGAIIYQGKANEQWVRMKSLDLLKAPGFGRKKPILVKAILATSGSISDPEIYRRQNLRIIEGDHPYSLDSLKTLLQELTQ